MKGIITKTAAGLCLCATLALLSGCVHYRKIVDPCWPERYNAMAKQSVRDMHNAQADKGHLLDQTIWNWMFETDPKSGAATDRLNGAGIEQLKLISRRLPVPDTQVYLQTAQDVPYVDGIAPEKLIQLRTDINNRRIQSIYRFLSTQTFTRGGAYQVAIHDFAPPGIPSSMTIGAMTQPPAQGAYPKLENNFQGVLPAGTSSSSGSSGAGGSTGGSSGGAGGAGGAGGQ